MLFSNLQDIEAAIQFYQSEGYCTFTNLLSDSEVHKIIEAIEQSADDGSLVLPQERMSSSDDVIYASPVLMDACRHSSIVNVARALVGHPVELQHAKLNAKPLSEDIPNSDVPWHQDYPFFPHTNHDLVACVIHLDDEDEGSGAMSFVPGSHLLGERSHLDENGVFVYRCQPPDQDLRKPTMLLARRGWISFHHCLTLHQSGIKTHKRPRRLLVYQYRAHDSVQLAGVIWRCNGFPVDPCAPQLRTARFPSGQSISLRGIGGRLYDIHGSLRPNTPSKSY